MASPLAWRPAGPAPRRTWHDPFAEALARLPGEQWARLQASELAVRIQADAGYQAAWLAAQEPQARRYILRPPPPLPPARLGLDECPRPPWVHLGALAADLDLSSEALWNLTLPAAWQRRRGLGKQHHRYRLLPKRCGGWRLLEVPAPYLMALQRRLCRQLLDGLPLHPAALGFRKGHSVLDHARHHAGQDWLLRFDLQDFFASVSASRVHALFRTLGYGISVARALTALTTTATPEPLLQRWHEQGGLDWTQRQRLRDPHLAQGAPSSPVLANLCAFGLDLRLQGLADAQGLRYSRYADDLVLSGDAAQRGSRDRLRLWVARIVAEEGFALNHRKTRCQGQGGRQTVCHLVVNQQANLPREEFDALKALLHRCATLGPATQNRSGRPDWRAHLQGRLAWARQVNPHKAQRLDRLWDQIDWNR
ncbi:MAG: reverse transcriptase family protein [Inhella sp.]